MIDASNIHEDKWYAIEGRDMKRVVEVMKKLNGITAIKGAELWDLAKQLEIVLDHGEDLT